MPSAAPERRRQVFLLIGIVAIGVTLWAMFGGSPEYPIAQTLGPAPTSNTLVTRGRGTSSRPTPPSAPQALKLAELEHVPDEPEAGRNLFRFGMKPAPPQPPPPPYVPPAYTPPPTPTPPPIPPIPLKLVFIIADPEQPTRNRAYLTDTKGNTFEAFQGDIVDGRYKMLRVGTTDVVMSHLDGSGQRVIRQGGQE
jgi:hypothetical protein